MSDNIEVSRLLERVLMRRLESHMQNSPQQFSSAATKLSIKTKTLPHLSGFKKNLQGSIIWALITQLVRAVTSYVSMTIPRRRQHSQNRKCVTAHPSRCDSKVSFKSPDLQVIKRRNQIRKKILSMGAILCG